MAEHLDALSDLVSRLPKAYNALRQDLLTIRVGNDFEPHGRATEDWEIVWTITLHCIPAHWRSITGWRQCTGWGADQAMKFRGETLADVVGKATAFVDWYMREKMEGA